LFDSINELDLEGKYIINDDYNKYYLNCTNISDNGAVPSSNIETGSKNKKHGFMFMSCWLLNVDRLILKSGIDVNDYHFLDVGCGKGISAIYVLDNYNFKSISGFDYSESLIKAAINNHQNSNIKNKDINLFLEDASSYVLEDKKMFIFMFNPFNNIVLQNFLDNNIDKLKKNKSIIAYANDNTLNLILKYNIKHVIMIPEYKCNIYFF